MLDALRILFALGLPLLTGAFFVCAVWPGWRRGGWALLLGLGFPLGLVGVIVGYILLGKIGIGLQFVPNIALQLGLAALLLPFVSWRLRADSTAFCGPSLAREWARLPMVWRWACVFLLAWMVLRLMGITLDVWLRPLQPWDAWYGYGTQTKVWFYSQQLDSFAGSWRWFSSEEAVWLAGAVRHPPGIALAQLWMLQTVGRWDPALMNLSWVMGLMSLGFLTFGFLRLAGGGLLLAVFSCWVMLSIPMVTVSVVLAGMGDFWIGLYLFIALSGIWAMRSGYGGGALVITALATMGLLVFKQSGAFWLPVIGLALAAAMLKIKWVLLLAVLSVFAAAGLIYHLGEPIRIGWIGSFGYVDGQIVRPEVAPIWQALVTNLFLAPNWALLWFVLPLLAVSNLRMMREEGALRSLSLAVWMGILMLLVLFIFTKVSFSVVDGTGVNRFILHLAPSMILMLCLTVEKLIDRAGGMKSGMGCLKSS